MSKNDRLLSGCSIPDNDDDPMPDIRWWPFEWWCRWCAAGTAATDTTIMATRVAISTIAGSKPIPPYFNIVWRRVTAKAAVEEEAAISPVTNCGVGPAGWSALRRETRKEVAAAAAAAAAAVWSADERAARGQMCARCRPGRPRGLVGVCARSRTAQVFEWFSTKMYSTKLSPDGWCAGIILRARRPCSAALARACRRRTGGRADGPT